MNNWFCRQSKKSENRFGLGHVEANESPFYCWTKTLQIFWFISNDHLVIFLNFFFFHAVVLFISVLFALLVEKDKSFFMSNILRELDMLCGWAYCPPFLFCNRNSSWAQPTSPPLLQSQHYQSHYLFLLYQTVLFLNL